MTSTSTTGMFPNSTPKKPVSCAECNRLLEALERITHVISSHQAVAIAKDVLHTPKETK